MKERRVVVRNLLGGVPVAIVKELQEVRTQVTEYGWTKAADGRRVSEAHTGEVVSLEWVVVEERPATKQEAKDAMNEAITSLFE